MLEALKAKAGWRSRTGWRWSAWGKHPLAKDYIQLGAPTPIGKAFAQWIGNGFQRLAGDTEEGQPACAWRFWAKGDGRSELVCGTIQTSSDKLGRPFPLLLMGDGRLEQWRRRWQLVPLALDGAWRRLEQLTSTIRLSITAFEETLTSLEPPRPDWGRLEREFVLTRQARDGSLPAEPPFAEQLLTGAGHRQVIWHPIPAEETATLLTQSVQLHLALKERSGAVPSVVFLGGVPAVSYIGFFLRSLRPEDFRSLWRPGTHNRG